MKTVKYFFTNNSNRLNKGYAANVTLRGERPVYKKKIHEILPPVEVLQEYEDVHPGTTAKMLLMAEQEQEHKYQTELENIKLQKLKIKLTKNIALLTVVILSCSAVLLSISINNIYLTIGLIFTILLSIVCVLPIYKKPAGTTPQYLKPNYYKQNKFSHRKSYKYK